MEDFSIGVLSWHSSDVLIQTLKSYYDNGLMNLTNDLTIYFQEITSDDIAIAEHFSAKHIGTKENIGIGAAFLKLATVAKHDKILLLEHDWNLIESAEVTAKRINQSLHLLDWGYDACRLRHREHPGFPHFSEANYSTPEKALKYHDPEFDLDYPHLLDTVHWCQEPDRIYKGKIGKQLIDDDVCYASSSRYACFTNNPVMYRKDFYIKMVKPFIGGGIDLEGKISKWWASQNFNVVHTSGLFEHRDFIKHPHNQRLIKLH